jgi:hypothetical protein
MAVDHAYDASFWNQVGVVFNQHVQKVAQPLHDEIASLKAQVKFLKETCLHYRGDYETGQSYAPGDCVRSGGSIWRALSATTDRPPGVTWQLLLRRARDGKDGKDARDAAA